MDSIRYDVFLSHSSIDKPRVRALAEALRMEALRVFIDEDQLKVGDSLYSSLNDALDASEFVVFCISSASVKSGWVEREIGGSITKQIKARRKRVLPVLLDDVDTPALLADLVWLDMSQSTPSEVAAQIQSAIQAARESWARSTRYPQDIKDQVSATLALLAGERAAPRFCWAIISGPSSAGKDVLSYIAIQRLQQRYGLAFLRKLTTRPRRPSEPDYVQQLDNTEFERRCRSGEIMFPFRKRTFRYGFDARQFREALGEGTPLLSVFTEFRLVPALVESMNAAGIRTSAFLIQTEKSDVLRRVLFRNLPPDEVASRIASIEQDFEEMGRRKNLEHEYTLILNGDSTAFRVASNTLTDTIRAVIEDTGATAALSITDDIRVTSKETGAPVEPPGTNHLRTYSVFLSRHINMPRREEVEEVVREIGRLWGLEIVTVDEFVGDTIDSIVENRLLGAEGLLQLVSYSRADLAQTRRNPDILPDLRWMLYEYGIAVGAGKPHARVFDTSLHSMKEWQSLVHMRNAEVAGSIDYHDDRGKIREALKPIISRLAQQIQRSVGLLDGEH